MAVQSTSIAASSLPIGSTTTDFILGAAPWSTGSYKFTGTLQDVRVYHKELSADQVWDLRNNVDPETLEAGGWGGGLYQAGASQVTIEASSLIENAAGRGGGLYQESGAFTGRNLTISTNTASLERRRAVARGRRCVADLCDGGGELGPRGQRSQHPQRQRRRGALRQPHRVGPDRRQQLCRRRAHVARRLQHGQR